MTMRGATYNPRVINGSDSVVFILFYMKQNIYLFIAFKLNIFCLLASNVLHYGYPSLYILLLKCLVVFMCLCPEGQWNATLPSFINLY